MAPRSPNDRGCPSPPTCRWATAGVALVALLTFPWDAALGGPTVETNPFDPKSRAAGATLPVVGPIHGPDTPLTPKTPSAPTATTEPPVKIEPSAGTASVPPSTPGLLASPSTAASSSEVAPPAPPTAPAGPNLLKRLFGGITGLFASPDPEKPPTGDAPTATAPTIPVAVAEPTPPPAEHPTNPPASVKAETPPAAASPAPAAPEGPSLFERLFGGTKGQVAATDAEKPPTRDEPTAPKPAPEAMAERPPLPAAEQPASLTVSAKSEEAPANDGSAPAAAITPPSDPTPLVSLPPATPPPEAPSPAPTAAPRGPSLLERLFGLFAPADAEKSPASDAPSTPAPVTTVVTVAGPTLLPAEPEASPADSAKIETPMKNDDGTPATAMALAPLSQPAAPMELPLPVIGKIRGPDNPAPEPPPPPSVPGPVPEPSVAAAPAVKPEEKPAPSQPAPKSSDSAVAAAAMPSPATPVAPAATAAVATPVALIATPPKPKPIPRPEPLRDVTLTLGDTIALGRTLTRDRLPAQSCIERRSWPAVFCVEPVDWPAEINAVFAVNSSLYRGAMAVARYEQESAVHYHAIFPTESFPAVMAYLERLYGPPTEQGDRMMAVVGQPRQPNPTVRWISIDGKTRETAVLEVRTFDDVRNFLPDTSFGTIRLFRENARPVFDILSPSDLLLLRMRQSTARVDDAPRPARP